MKVISLFDGISCARVALERAGIPVDVYFASEIDKHAIEVSQKNYPDIKHIGSVTDVKVEKGGIVWSGGGFTFSTEVDLLIGGSPCQDLSIAKRDRKGLEGDRSGLFYEYVRILKEVKPKYFILENVASMPKEARETISKELGVEPIMINAALVSAQQRKRLFWTNIPNVTLPEDKGIFLKDILISGIEEKEKSLCITATYARACPRDYFEKHSRQLIKVAEINNSQSGRIYSIEGKSVTLNAGGGGLGAKTGLYAVPVAFRNRGDGKKAEFNGTGKANSMTTVPTDSMVAIIPEATKKGYAIAEDGDSVDLSFPNSKTRRGRVGKKVKNLMTSPSIGVFTHGIFRKLHPIECERLQSLPDEYTGGASPSQRYKMLGNAFNVDVVAHILSFIPKQ